MNILAAATSTAEHVALPLQFEIISMVVLTLILVADVLMIFKRPHIPSAKESTLWVVAEVLTLGVDDCVVVAAAKTQSD